MTAPKNSYTIPNGYPLFPGVAYYWRVRPRLGENPSAMPWSPTWSFVSPGASSTASVQSAPVAR